MNAKILANHIHMYKVEAQISGTPKGYACGAAQQLLRVVQAIEEGKPMHDILYNFRLAEEWVEITRTKLQQAKKEEEQDK